ncbi:hypothetical protein COV82_04805 [Candidatus Peregrinibacteria bacterium CG11_big_fil_rev_8_21_14_0_20_46_8]|nr:MAG: hypothetical protein COV82_04805 [Candidatus Peregrinibacteria bacterium CG11_big_fil_rev_8_21_14_0_20_46_8]
MSFEFLELLAFSFATIIGYIAWIIIIVGLAVSIFDLIVLLFNKKKTLHADLNQIRIKLGLWLLLGLEFLIAKDVILTIFDPSTNDLVNLALIIIIRVLLSYFLHRELKDIKLHKE